ncbi:kininogen-1 isoform X2 [Tamandua tetradactyla]|uniref:kininogen-1 isoform X2 n=1 Tax=Tamandua tetradactyla TaxID=48850 RepID=UPI0040538895
MKLIVIIFFCSRLLPSLTQESSSQEVDCNDEDVFKAADAALKKYNDESQSGNQFVLYRVFEVTKMDAPDTFYSLKYQIKEGDCPVKSGKTWQDCDYNQAAGASTGECTAIVWKRENQKFNVNQQTCHITPAEGPVVTTNYNCLGCVRPVSTNSSDLQPILRHAIEHFNNNTNWPHLFAVGKLKKAQSQVVAGWNFEITYSIVQTNCSKENFLVLTPDCMSLLNGNTGECRDSAYVDPQGKIASFSQKCDVYPVEDFVQPPTNICVGCPMDIPVNSPELEEPLKHSIEKFNAENNENFYFKIDSVQRATVQVVAGQKFSIWFKASETTCSKESNKELTESCEAKKNGQILDCTAEVYVIPWEKKIYPTVKCGLLEKTSLMKRPPGFSPFRSIQMEKTEEGTTVSPPHTSMAPIQDEEQDPGKEQEPTHGHGWNHKNQIRHGLGHGHKHEHGRGRGHQWGHGLGHGHQRGHGLGHGHKRDHGPAHGHKHDHGHGHGKHKIKGKNHGKHNGWRTEHMVSSSEDSTTSFAQTQEKTERPIPIPSLAPPGEAVTFSNFQDSDLIATVMTNIPPTPTENDDDWIPDIQIKPNSLSFNLITDFPEITTPKCPGRPWKPVSGITPTIEVNEFRDFDLLDALS